MLTSYGIGQYAPAAPTEAHMCAQSRTCRPGRRGLLLAHGKGGNALGLIGLDGAANWYPITANLQNLDAPILMADLDGDAWGNDTAQGRMTSAQSYIQTAFAAEAGKVILIGGSMGGLVTLNWARNNPAQVAAVALLYPCVNLQAQHDGTGGATPYASSIEAAYGGLSGYQSALPTHDPSENAAAYTNAFPIRIYYSTADNQVGTANITSFAAAVDGSQLSTVSLGPAAHFDTSAIPLADLNAWLANFA